jgi:hypothetical protein
MAQARHNLRNTFATHGDNEWLWFVSRPRLRRQADNFCARWPIPTKFESIWQGRLSFPQQLDRPVHELFHRYDQEAAWDNKTDWALGTIHRTPMSLLYGMPVLTEKARGRRSLYQFLRNCFHDVHRELGQQYIRNDKRFVDVNKVLSWVNLFHWRKEKQILWCQSSYGCCCSSFYIVLYSTSLEWIVLLFSWLPFHLSLSFYSHIICQY